MLTKDQVQEYGDFLLTAIDAHLSRKLIDLERRITDRFDKLLSDLRDAQAKDQTAGRDALEAVGRLRDELLIAINEVEKQPGPPGNDGKTVTLEDIVPLVRESVALIAPTLKGEPGEPGKPGAPGEPGKPGEKGDTLDMDVVEVLVADAVAKQLPGYMPKQEQIDELIERAVAKIEVVVPEPVHGKDGTSVTIEQLRPVVEGEVAKAVLALPRPRDGQDGKSVTIADVLPELQTTIAKTLAEWPRPKDGRDAISVSDIGIASVDGGRSIKFVFKAGDEVITREIENDFVIDRGAWRDTLQARRGDLVTHAGSTWLAQRQTTDKPGTSDAWRMAVKSALAKTTTPVRL